MQKTNDNRAGTQLTPLNRLILLFLRAFFQLLYHQLAWTYDAVASIVSMGAWQKWVQSVVPFLQGPKVLEIGFGPGHLQLSMHQNKVAVFGVDESRQMVHLAQRRLLYHGYFPSLIRGEAQALPFANQSFDQVVMTFPAEFILIPATLSEIKRILCQQGMAVILPLAWITGRKPWERLIAWINRITGEAPDWNPKILDRLTAAGFNADWQMINFSNSKVVIIRLSKV